MIRRSTILAAVAVATLGLAGCSTVSRLNPFDNNKDDPAETAGEGQRISIIPADQRLEPAEALKGVDFALPPPIRLDAWPLPGGAEPQLSGKDRAGARFADAETFP